MWLLSPSKEAFFNTHLHHKLWWKNNSESTMQLLSNCNYFVKFTIDSYYLLSKWDFFSFCSCVYVHLTFETLQKIIKPPNKSVFSIRMLLAASKNNSKPNWLEQERECTRALKSRRGLVQDPNKTAQTWPSFSLGSFSSGLTSFPGRLSSRTHDDWQQLQGLCAT